MEPSQTPRDMFSQILAENRPQAVAWVRGGKDAASLSGLVKFFDTPYGGILVEAEIFGLPNISRENSSDFYGIHIHERGDCSGDFSGAGGHYNPNYQPHPRHRGDLLPLLGSQGYAWGGAFMINGSRFMIFWAVPWSSTGTGMISPASHPAIPGK